MTKNPSKEKIINQAIQFHLEGNISKAIKYYQYCVDIGLNDERVFSNYGVILQNLGKFNEAEHSYRKAIEINPDYAEALSNLGDILRNLGKFKEAEKYTRKAIKIKPNFAGAYSNLGSILRNLNKLNEAEKYTRKAIQLNPNFAAAHLNRGNILKDLGKLKEAENSTRKAIELNPNYSDAYSNLGTILWKFGKLKEADNYTLKAIELNPNFAAAHLNRGNILKDLGKLKEAENSTRKAIQLNPHRAIAHSSLGNILQQLGKLKEAESSYRKAIKLNPNSAAAHNNLGAILRDLGKAEKEAQLCIQKAIEIEPNLAEGHFNMGNILRDLGKTQESFNSYMKVIKINPTFSNIYPSITQVLKELDISKLNKIKLKNIFNILLERNDVAHKELFDVFNFLYSKKIIINIERMESNFSKIEYLINEKGIDNSFKKIILKNIQLEKALTNLRKNLCISIANNKEEICVSQLKFIIYLGQQCFLNEYIYSLNIEEKMSLNMIINRCIDGELSEANIAILSCYYPLYKLINQIPSLKSFHSSNQIFKELIELQIIEPLKEIELSKKIKKLGSINDLISKKVKSQYEENPYPRWRYGSHKEIQKLSINEAINNEIKPNYIAGNNEEQQLKVLIAGCGTGNQILQSQRYKNAQVTAIDLSLASLAYAQRKINELGINNVELIEMDILEVNLLGEQFDIIECGGVLHHMDNPSKGLRKLLDNLKKKGYLKLGFYSELARKDIIKAREYIQTKNIQPNNEDIKDFRDDVFSGKIEQISNLCNWSDFYTMSECRDLCFHAQEHRFTINKLQEILQSNKLRFLGFLLSKQIKSLYDQYFPKDNKQTNLKNWGKFEEMYPKTFRGMYQFWVSKI